MKVKKFFSILLCGAVMASFTACENSNPPVDEKPDGDGTQTEQPDEPETPMHEGHEYVDLGLSSGLLWATCNIGAKMPKAVGDEFAWGETEPKSDYSWDNYAYGSDEDELTKYCTDAEYGKNGFTDNKTVLDPEDDAAHANWGGEWRMPTKAEFDELMVECEWEWYGSGYEVKGSTGNSIFLPADGSYGFYWSSSLNTDYPGHAYYVTFYSYHYDWYYDYRFLGRSVRAVCSSR